ncbi:hypothetical protein BYT27DRAFT_7188147 [Phlegmacium glaucopus]|nr:hypothetical protein BYT27DRAFT_7188147 [Phlegmacium glaucopus]
MAQPEPKLQSLSDANQTALHALLSAIDPEGVGSADGKLTSDVVTKLSEKLSELVGPEAVESFKQDRNERGELLNEEGLPIIDITEPVDDKQSQTTETLPTSIVEEPSTPLSSLPTSVRARRNEQVNRVLDYLEEEEREEELKEKQRELEGKHDMMQKRKIQEAEEKANIKATKELQKKMGRALLQNIGKAKEKERQEQEAQRLQDEEADKGRSPSLKKKTVAFVDALDVSENDAADPDPSQGPDWGDVTLARLRASKRPTLLSQSLLDKHPMKMSVVERFPAGPPTFPNSPHPDQRFADSDDESDPAPESESSDTAAGDENDDESIVLEQEEVDFDFVQHQRQIALEYHRKRNKFGQDAAEAIMNPLHADDTPLESTPDVTRESSKPAVSQFRASRIASAYSASAPSTSASTSLGASIVPVSSSRTIQRALRTGKLDSDGRLVGGEVDSTSEDEDPARQEVLELLKKGEVYNLGPDGNYIHTIPPRSNPRASTSTATPSANEDPSASKSLPPSRRSQTSKFKPSRPAEGRLFPSDPIPIPSLSISHTHEPLSPSITPVSHAGRSSPKLETSQAIAPQVHERRPLADPASASSSSNFVTGKSAASPFSMIVDSPSFPAPQGPQGMPETVIPSLSAPPTRNTTRPDHPPAVLSSAVMQSDRSQAPQLNETSQQAAKTKKISRFKAERS